MIGRRRSNAPGDVPRAARSESTNSSRACCSPCFVFFFGVCMFEFVCDLIAFLAFVALCVWLALLIAKIGEQ